MVQPRRRRRPVKNKPRLVSRLARRGVCTARRRHERSNDSRFRSGSLRGPHRLRHRGHGDAERLGWSSRDATKTGSHGSAPQRRRAAAIFDRPVVFTTHACDLLAGGAADALGAFHPAVVVQAASVQSSSVIAASGNAWSRLVAEGGLSTTAVFQAVLSTRVAAAMTQPRPRCSLHQLLVPGRREPDDQGARPPGRLRHRQRRHSVERLRCAEPRPGTRAAEGARPLPNDRSMASSLPRRAPALRRGSSSMTRRSRMCSLRSAPSG